MLEPCAIGPRIVKDSLSSASDLLIYDLPYKWVLCPAWKFKNNHKQDAKQDGKKSVYQWQLILTFEASVEYRSTSGL